MIRREDFKVEISGSERGAIVRVTHKPTGNERVADPVSHDEVGKTRPALIVELRGKLFRPEDIRVDIGQPGCYRQQLTY